jgi:hypothetical protein
MPTVSGTVPHVEIKVCLDPKDDSQSGYATPVNLPEVV